MDFWDIFLSDTLETRRGLATADVRSALAKGTIRPDDLIRRSGTKDPWAAVSDRLPPEAASAAAPTQSPPAPPDVAGRAGGLSASDRAWAESAYDDDDDETPAKPQPQEASAPLALVDDDSAELPVAKPASARPAPAANPQPAASFAAADLPIDRNDLHPGLAPKAPADLPSAEVAPEWNADPGPHVDDLEIDPLDEDEAAASFTLTRGAADKVEELDLAAMVDVAFQLVLFFLVTATSVIFKTMDVPKPNQDAPAPGASQGARSMDDLQREYILVEIDPAGSIQVDHEPVRGDYASLVEKLRQARESTGRKTMMLTADYQTRHKSTVMAFDAAQEIGLEISFPKPSRDGPPPAPAPKTSGL